MQKQVLSGCVFCTALYLALPVLAAAQVPSPLYPPAPAIRPSVANCTVCMFLKQAKSPFITFSRLLDRANFYEKLASRLLEGPLTIFAPRDGYLNRHVNDDIITFLMAPGNEDILLRVLYFHIIRLDAGVDRLRTGWYFTLSGDWLSAMQRVFNGRVRLDGGAPVKLLNFFNSSGGYISGYDGLLLPPAVKEIVCREHVWLNCSQDLVTPGAPGAAAPAPALAPSSPRTPGAVALDALSMSGRYSTFLSALRATNVDVIVRSWRGPITILAPPNVAIEMGPENVAQAFADPSSKAVLTIVLHHILPLYVTLANAVNRSSTTYTTLNNDSITATSTTHFVMFDGVNTINTIADVAGSTSALGIVKVLVPAVLPGPAVEAEGALLLQVMRSKGRYSKFLEALSYTGLTELLSSYSTPLTILAPVDESFNMTFTFEQQRLEAILLSHLLPLYYRIDMLRAIAPGNVTTLEGGHITVSQHANGSSIHFSGNGTVTLPDEEPYQDGIGSIIEVKGLIMPLDMGSSGRPFRSSQITDALTAAGNYSTLISLMELSSHKSLLQNPSNPITLLAFSDQAMTDLVKMQSDNSSIGMRRYANGLEQLISYHIVEGYYTRQLLQGVAPYNLSTWSGTDILLTRTNGSTLLLNLVSRINKPDILANDLVSVQGVDAVLVPMGLFRSTNPEGPSNTPGVSSAPPGPRKEPHGRRMEIVGGLVAAFGGLILLAMCCLIAFLVRRRRKLRAKLSQPKFTVGPNPNYSHKVDGEYVSEGDLPTRR